ncbi:MAG TPA: 5-oxoprolinase subunit PxpB [Rhodanobacteraceae bacterium]|nr:5-oxoprolinase subunit PxpB [Rhodanobacteraceae bacterium]
MAEFSIETLSEDALLLRLGDRIDAEPNARIHAIAARLRDMTLPGIHDIAPAYASLLVRFDPFATDGADVLRDSLRKLASEPGVHADTSPRLVEIPVCYGGEHGVDLQDVARHAGLDTQQLAARHASMEYRVAMLGFAPGFPYLLGMDPSLHVPRRATPRTRVPAGSVAIGGTQTGFYPRELPGGWQLIGRTPLTLFDAQRDPPCLLAPGDRVRFRAIDADEFAALTEPAEERGEGSPLFDLRDQGRSRK